MDPTQKLLDDLWREDGSRVTLTARLNHEGAITGLSVQVCDRALGEMLDLPLPRPGAAHTLSEVLDAAALWTLLLDGNA